MKRSLLLFAVGLILAAGMTYFVMSGRLSDALSDLSVATRGLDTANTRIEQVEAELTTTQKSLTGYTEYRNVLAVGKKVLEGHTKLLTAKIKRPEGYTRFLKKSMFGLPSNGAVEITYDAEYLFGYDLTAGKYEIVDTNNGIEIRVGKPILLGAPAVTNMRYRILSDGYLTDEKSAVAALLQDASKRALKAGHGMVGTLEIQALCEKQLEAFFSDILVKQGKVEILPRITIVSR